MIHYLIGTVFRQCIGMSVQCIIGMAHLILASMEWKIYKKLLCENELFQKPAVHKQQERHLNQFDRFDYMRLSFCIFGVLTTNILFLSQTLL